MVSLARVSLLTAQVDSLPVGVQRIAAEMLMLRLASILEIAISETFLKRLCGAAYLDGTLPAAVVTAKSLEDADDLMRSHGRASPAKFTRWLYRKSVEDNSKLVFGPNEHCVSALSRFSSDIDEIRRVRNHIAHGNSGTAKDYYSVVLSYYGVGARRLPCGVFLTSKSVYARGMLRAYASKTSVIIKDLVKG